MDSEYGKVLKPSKTKKVRKSKSKTKGGFSQEEIEILKKWVNTSESDYEETQSQQKMRRDAVNKLLKKAKKDEREKRALKVVIRR